MVGVFELITWQGWGGLACAQHWEQFSECAPAHPWPTSMPPAAPHSIYGQEKIEAIATKVYGAASVEFSPEASVLPSCGLQVV